MMDLWSKICTIYPELKDNPAAVLNGQIQLRNLNDGNGDFIAVWDWPGLPRPTQEQLDAIQ